MAKRGALNVPMVSVAHPGGSWGPKAADALNAADGGWYNPTPAAPEPRTLPLHAIEAHQWPSKCATAPTESATAIRLRAES